MEKGDLEALQDLPRPVSVSGAKGMKKIKKSKNCEIKTQGGRYIVLMKEEKKKKKVWDKKTFWNQRRESMIIKAC